MGPESQSHFQTTPFIVQTILHFSTFPQNHNQAQSLKCITQ